MDGFKRKGKIMSDDNTSEGVDLEQTIRESASGPKKVAGDAGSVEQHSISELIEADKYLASKEVAKSRGLGIKLTKIVPDGTT